MNDLAILALVIVALYGSECMIWARHGAVILTAPFFVARTRLHVLGRSLGNARGALTLLNPLPPFGRIYVVEPWPFSASTQGVISWRSFSIADEPRPPQSLLRYGWGEIERIGVDDKTVRINGKSFATCTSPRHARVAADVLMQLKDSKDKVREKLLEKLLAAHLDPSVPRTLAERHERLGMPAMVAATGVFAALFITVPRTVVAEGLTHWPRLVLLVYAFVFLSSLSTYVAHRLLQKEARGDRWLQTLLMLPAPTMAMRGNDKLGRWLLTGSHPIAAALGVLEGRHRTDVVGRALRDLHTPRHTLPGDDDTARTIEADFRARVLRQTTALAQSAGIDVAACLSPPALRPGQVAYCPRCQATYNAASEVNPVCADCGVVLTRPS